MVVIEQVVRPFELVLFLQDDVTSLQIDSFDSRLDRELLFDVIFQLHLESALHLVDRELVGC